jgi:AraC-like DNA-binding protein
MNFITRTIEDAVVTRHHIYSDSKTNVSNLEEKASQIAFPTACFSSEQWTFDGITIARQRWQCEGSERNAVAWNHDFDGVYLDYLLSGQQTATNNRWPWAHVMAGQQHSMLYTRGYEGATWSDTPESEMVMFKIEKSAWLRVTEDANDTLRRFTEAIMEGRSTPLSAYNLPLDHQMKTVIHQMMHGEFTGGLKKMFLFSKCLELIVLQAEAFNQHEQARSSNGNIGNATSRSKPRIARSEKEQLYYAQEYLRDCIEEPPSLPELARLVGLNEYKLKRGFKAMFGTTVFGYVAEHRLERAQTLLLEKEKSVSEIAYELGYSSPQHFSTAFKKKFGVPPKHVR